MTFDALIHGYVRGITALLVVTSMHCHVAFKLWPTYSESLAPVRLTGRKLLF